MRIVNEFVFWGAFGLMVEVCFTAIRKLLLQRKFNLMGFTSLWMFPIYALGLTHGFDLIAILIKDDVIRYLSYPLWIWGVEIIIHFQIIRFGFRFWNYSYLPKRFHWRGIISLIHYPFWVAFGILVETIKL